MDMQKFLPDASPLNSFGCSMRITLISCLQLPSSSRTPNQAPGLASEGNVGKGEKGSAAECYREQQVRAEMESGCANPKTSFDLLV